MKQSNSGSRNSIGSTCRTIRVIIAIVFLYILYSLLNPLPMAEYRIHRYNGTNGHTETSWTLSSGGEILEENISLPRFVKLETGRIYRLSCTLSYDGSEDRAPYAFFYIHHMYCSAYLDHLELFSYDKTDIHKADHSRSPGNIYTAVPLPHDCLGREFSIEFTPPLDNYIDFELPNTLFGDYSTISYYTYIQNLPHNIIIILAAFMGITAILFSTLVLSGSAYREGIYIGIFALLFSLYNVTECSFNFYVISNPYLTYLLNYAAFSALPIFLIAFLRERLEGKSRSLCIAFSIVGCILFFTEAYLHFTGVMDLKEFLPILHIWYFTEAFLIVLLMLLPENRQNAKSLLIQVLPILGGSVLDGISYYAHWNISGSDAPFTSGGVVIFLIVEIYHVWKSSIRIYTQSIRSQDYLRMAYIDSLTGIGNRGAFDALKKRITAGELPHDSMAVISVDLNNLKIANDTLGHAAGDYLIRSTANILSDMAESCGHCFRIGGDEFLVILNDLDDTEVRQKIAQAEALTERLNSNSKAILSLAFGWEFVQQRNMDAAISAADKKMYRDKAKKKACMNSSG